jgi:hypothetical protein
MSLPPDQLANHGPAAGSIEHRQLVLARSDSLVIGEGASRALSVGRGHLRGRGVALAAKRPTIRGVGTRPKPLWLFRRRDPDAAQHTMLTIAELRVELLRAATVYGVRSAMSLGDTGLVWVWREWLEDVEGLVDRVWTSANRLGRMTAGGEEVPDWPALLLEQVLTYQAQRSKPTLHRGSTTCTQEWIETLERLAVRARNVEELNGQPLGEIEGEEFGAGVALLGAVEDSLVLVASADPDKQARRADAMEIHTIALAARDAGIWDLRPRQPGKRGRSQAFGEINPTDQATIERAKELTERLVMTTIETVRFYQQLAPVGRELAGDARKTVHERLDRNGLCLRDAHTDRDLLAYLAVKEGIDFRSTVEVLRLVQRSLVLALSDDPGRRARAISEDKLVSFFRPVYEFTAELWGLPAWGELTPKG